MGFIKEPKEWTVLGWCAWTIKRQPTASLYGSNGVFTPLQSDILNRCSISSMHQWALPRSFILKRSHNAIFNSFFDDSLFERMNFLKRQLGFRNAVTTSI
ncbi:putative subtilisin-like proteinase [Trichinella spiralis]|uniref:Subtilisin-like proteinase n=1 Tax=Trichinella spiralis TaxID=6334 RepID=A0ABR3K8W6_TRISP